MTEQGGIILSVPGIPGPYCAYGLEKRLIHLPGVARIHIDWANERLVLDMRRSATLPGKEEIERAVEAADYPYAYTILKGSHEDSDASSE